MYKFIWNRHYLAAKAPERIKREILNKPVKLGGYGMLDIASLDESLKLKAVGRLLSTQHPFLTLLRDKCNFNDFFNPTCPIGIESVTSKGMELITFERAKLWDNSLVRNNTSLLQKVKATSIGKVLSPAGKLSIPFFLIRRRGASTLGEITARELGTLERYIENRKLPLIKISMVTPMLNNPVDIEGSLVITKGKFKDLRKCTSKEIRESRMQPEPVVDLKLGIFLTKAEALCWGLKLSKLTAIKHKNFLLRVAHGEIYTKVKLHKFGLVDNNCCPRCGEAETLVHKFIECDYAKRIWRRVNCLRNLTPVELDKNILGCDNETNLTNLTINAEVLMRLSYLRDEQNYLIHPKIFVANCLKSIATHETKNDIRNEVKSLLEL